jgi:ABC-type Fe3+-hydroxamate transport system substrate-binding protein
MRHRNRFVRAGIVILAVTAALAACSSLGDLTISNESSTDVTVSAGGDEIIVSAGGGASILGSGCTPGDVTVEFTSGETFVVAGPVCPEEQLVVRDGTVELQPSS